MKVLTRCFITVAALSFAACGEQPALGGGTGGGTGARDAGPDNTAVDAGQTSRVDAGPQTDAGVTTLPGDAGTTLPPADAGVRDAGAACMMKHWYKDADSDGYGDPAMVQDACNAPFGYVSANTDCDDSNADRHPGAPELCNTIDDDCDGLVNGTTAQAASCEAAKGSFDGGFRMYTAEKVGSSVINEMPCNGGHVIKIDPSATPVVSGSVVCTYSGGLSAFDRTQYGTIAGSLDVTGKLSLQRTGTGTAGSDEQP